VERLGREQALTKPWAPMDLRSRMT